MDRNLQVGIRRYPHSELFFERTHELSGGLTLDVHPWPDRAPFSEHERFDVIEMPILNYLAARELGLAVSALPVFPSRRFVQWMLEVPPDSGISGPADLAGKRIGSSYYGNIDYVWTRGILTEDYGVDLGATTWVTTRPEKVPGARVPASVRLHQGAVLDDLLVAGTIDAKFVDDHGHPPDPAMRRLWAHPEEEIQRWYGRSGYFPILHTVVVRDRVLVDHPQLARELYQLFEAAKTVALVKYEYGAGLPERYHDISLRAGFPGATRDGVSRAYLGQDPIPYGLQPNREELERLIRYAHAQEAISAAPAVEDAFVDVGA